eukprot:15914_1
MCKLPLIHVLRVVSYMLVAFLSLTIPGYQAILPILEDEKIFNDLCNDEEKKSELYCTNQLLRLDLMFNVGVNCMTMACLFFGWINMQYGSKLSLVIGTVLLTVGSVVFSFGWDWGCFVSYSLIGMGGTGLAYCILAVPAAYPVEIQGFLFSLLIGGLDASAGIFYIFYVFYKHANVSFQALFVSLAVITIIACIIGYCFVFNTYYFSEENMKALSLKGYNQIQDSPDKKGSIQQPLMDEEQQTLQRTQKKEDVSAEKQVIKADKLTPESFPLLKDVFKSIDYIALTIWFISYFVTKFFYMTTVDKQISWITNGDQHLINRNQQIFSIMYLCGGLFCLLTGPILGKLGIKIAIIIMAFMSMIMASCSVIQNYNLQYFTMVAFFYNRFFFYATAPMVFAIVFGIKRQQFLYGIENFLGAIVNLGIYGLDYLVVHELNGNFTVVNMSLGGVCFVMSIIIAVIIFTKT